MLKSSIALNVRPRNRRKYFPQQRSPRTLCICDGLEHNSLVETLHDFDFGLRTLVKPRADFHRTKHDDVIKIHMRDCQSPNLNSANIYFWPLGGHYAKYNSCQIFRLHGMLKLCFSHQAGQNSGNLYMHTQHINCLTLIAHVHTG